MADSSSAEPLHEPAAGEWYCKVHRALFEWPEAKMNDGDCPWCGNEVEGLDLDELPDYP